MLAISCITLCSMIALKLDLPQCVGGDDLSIVGIIAISTRWRSSGRAVDCCTARWRGILSAMRSSTPLKVLIPQQLITIIQLAI